MSTDLRDGNQASFEPMNAERKLRLFRTLCDIGFKEIEVAFPSISQTEFDFVRRLIDDGLIPDEVTIEVLSHAREPLLRRSVEALLGAGHRPYRQRDLPTVSRTGIGHEGCLFGNSERTGNVDLVTLAQNLYTQGIAPGLDFSDINAVVRDFEACTGLSLPPRQPYAGELVFTALAWTAISSAHRSRH